MKKILSVMIAGSIMLSMVACGGSEENSSKSETAKKENTTTSTTTTTTTTTTVTKPVFDIGEEIWIKGYVEEVDGKIITLKDNDGFTWTVDCLNVDDFEQLYDLVYWEDITITGKVTGDLKVDFLDVEVNGKTYTVNDFSVTTTTITTKTTTTQNNSSFSYVFNTHTMKFHYSDCSEVSKIKDENKEIFNGSREDAIAQGYSPCGKCHP